MPLHGHVHVVRARAQRERLQLLLEIETILVRQRERADQIAPWTVTPRCRAVPAGGAAAEGDRAWGAQKRVFRQLGRHAAYALAAKPILCGRTLLEVARALRSLLTAPSTAY
jgi:hypothetical protein